MKRRRKSITMNLTDFRKIVPGLSRPVIVTMAGEPIGKYKPIRSAIKPDVTGDAEPEVVK